MESVRHGSNRYGAYPGNRACSVKNGKIVVHQRRRRRAQCRWTNVICPSAGCGIRITLMRIWANLAVTVVLFASACGSWAQDEPRTSAIPNAHLESAARKNDKSKNRIQAEDAEAQQTRPRALTREDRHWLISMALHDHHIRVGSRRDCSHLVHAIYVRAGLPYPYAQSSDIYDGVEPFQRVKRPQPGDLIVWRGHVGMVMNPRQHLFYSFTSSGPATNDYESAYWKSRGRPRFYRYVKGADCSGCTPSAPSLRRTREEK